MTFYKNLSGVAFVVSLFVLFGGILPDAVSAANLPTCTFSASPATTVYGGTATLEWETTDANTVYINNGIGYVNQSDTISLTGFNSDVIYTLTAINAEGSRECSARVNVDNDDNDYNYLAPTCNITASPESVSYNGSVVLSWSSYGASSARINNDVGYVQKDGSRIVEHITDTTTFSLVVSNDHGSNTCKVTVYKDTVPGGPAPTCTIDINNNVLSWNAYHSNSAQIDNGIGYVTSSGSRVITPSNSTTYTMAVTDSVGRVGYCSETITVPNIYYGGGSYYGSNTYPQYNTEYATYGNTISLGSLPYTGANDVLYVLVMLLVAAGSTFAVYMVGRELV